MLNLLQITTLFLTCANICQQIVKEFVKLQSIAHRSFICYVVQGSWRFAARLGGTIHALYTSFVTVFYRLSNIGDKIALIRLNGPD